MSALPELHSVRAELHPQGAVVLVSKTEGAHRRFGLVREAFDRAERDLDALFARYEVVRDELEAVGVLGECRLSPVLQAAYVAWQDAPEPRIELARPRLTEAPIPPRG